MPNKTNYDANFTAGGLLFTEFVALRGILLSTNFDELLKKEEEENNVMGVATNSARKRIISEVKRRYEKVSIDFWYQFFEWDENEQKLGLFYLCLKTYPIVFDLHFEVAVKKYKLGAELVEYDVQMRLDELSSTSEDVENWSYTTIKKINTQYRKALKDAGLYNKKIVHKPNNTNELFWDFFKKNDENWFLDACFI